MTRKTLITCFTATAGALAVTVVLSTGPASVAQTAAPDAADARAPFSVLARPAGSGDALPPGVRVQFEPVAAEKGLDLDRARALAPSGRGYVWLLSGPKAVCVAIPDPVDGFGVGCGDAADAAAGRLWVTVGGLPGQHAGDARVALLMPDGIEAITAVAGDGSRRTVDVANNVALADLVDADHVELPDGSSVDVPGTPPALVRD